MEERITLDDLRKILDDTQSDFEKAYEKNNKAAATRARKNLSILSEKCKEARKQLMEHKKSIKKGG